MGFFRQEYWSGLPCPPLRYPGPGIKLTSSLAGGFFTHWYHLPWGPPGKNTGVGCHFLLQCRKVKRESEVAQSCLTLSDPMDCSPPGSSVHGIFQARVLQWVTIGFSGYLATLVHFICPDGCVFYLQNSVSLKLCPRL